MVVVEEGSVMVMVGASGSVPLMEGTAVSPPPPSQCPARSVERGKSACCPLSPLPPRPPSPSSLPPSIPHTLHRSLYSFPFLHPSLSLPAADFMSSPGLPSISVTHRPHYWACSKNWWGCRWGGPAGHIQFLQAGQ